MYIWHPAALSLLAWAAITAAAVIARPASACTGAPGYWIHERTVPDPADGMAATGPIVLDGLEGPADRPFVDVIDTIELVVRDGEGAVVPGQLSEYLFNKIAWWPDAPLVPGAPYTLSLGVAAETNLATVRELDTVPLRVVEPRPSYGPVSARLGSVRAEHVEMRGACLGRGDCQECVDYEILGVGVRLFARVDLWYPDDPYASARFARLGIGTDAEAAFAALESGFYTIQAGREANVSNGMSALIDWPDRGCAAVEVTHPVAGVLYREALCFDVPDEPPPEPEPEPEIPAEPEPDAADSGGCGITPFGPSPSVWWALPMMLCLARRGRGWARTPTR